MPHPDDVWTLKKYLLYDFARDRLANRRLFASHDAATQAAKERASVMVVPLVLKRARAADESVPCECARWA
jgi:hypothetical protein